MSLKFIESPKKWDSDTRDSTSKESYILFSAGNQNWAISAASTDKVFTLDKITPIPLAPVEVIGLANVKGEVVPVFDLPALLNMPSSAFAQKNGVCILIDSQVSRFGLLVDSIFRIASNDIKARNSVETNISLRILEVEKMEFDEIDTEKLVRLLRARTIKAYKEAGIREES